MAATFKVFIDGEAGTTGLQIRQRLDHHPDIDVVSIDHDKRKDLSAKQAILNSVDVCILCLPDEAAKEAAKLCEELGVRVLDASSAHRTHADWTYGLPELTPKQRSAISTASKVSNPGCYATGANLLLKPLTQAGFIHDEQLISVNAVSGYSGGGKQMIERYESEGSNAPTFGLYGLEFQHKHTPEIHYWSGIKRRPVFIPSVSAYAQGMLVHIMLDHQQLNKAKHQDIISTLQHYYANEALIPVHNSNFVDNDTAPFLTPHAMEGSNRCEIFGFGNNDAEQSLIVAKLDNLGKGASGACVQNLNIMLGLDELTAVEI